MTVLLMYLALALGPVSLMLVVDRAVKHWSRSSRVLRSPPPAVRSVQQLVADLARLNAEQRTLAHAGVTSRGLRLRAVSLAYDDTLRACCRAVGVEEPPTPLSSFDRLQVEAVLAMHGLTW